MQEERSQSNVLTPKQERFAQEYLVDLNGKQAAIRAGYSPRSAEVTASRLLRHDKVGASLRRLQAQTQERLEITRDTVLEGLYREATDEGSNGTARVQAWAHIGKILGVYVEKTEHGGAIRHLHSAVADLTTEELRELIAQGGEGRYTPRNTPTCRGIPNRGRRLGEGVIVEGEAREI